MNKVSQIIDQIINSDLSLEEYAAISGFLADQMKDKLYVKFVVENLVSGSTVRFYEE